MEFLNKFYINKTNLLNNIEIIKSHLKSTTKFCAVVKANAYGVGLREVVQIIKNEVDYYAVANIHEALELRSIDAQKEILVLGFVDLSDIKKAIENNICITIISKDYMLRLIEFVKREKLIGLKVHIKLNTGLNRFGLNESGFNECEQLFHNCSIEVVGCYTHFATKIEDKDFINEQFEKFEKCVQKLSGNILKHCANSYVALNAPDKQMDMVRVGFNMYGMEENEFGLKPVISIESEIINIVNLKTGDTLGYDRTFKADRDIKIAVVPIGYADGFARSLSNNFQLFVNGNFAQVVGRVCMDVCYIDITNFNVSAGDKVEIMGEKIVTTKFSNILSTSPYEILLNFGKIRADRIIAT